MTPRTRIAFVVAAALVTTAYFLPLWNVYLQAPQYPEGLGMRIWASTITGLKPNDLENINNLNHYIGMKRIVPDSIPELRVMPQILVGLAAFALLVAVAGRRRLAQIWLAAFLALSVAGLADFWKWEYDYGHDLDMENAIIKVPGMNYQPPLIGSKQLLNFRATSVPGTGGILLMVAVGLGAVALVTDRRRQTVTRPEGRALASPATT
jgi:hypothetical protein